MEHSAPTWRDNAFIALFAVELPLLGDFFKRITFKEAFYAAGKCLAALAGGTITMMNILIPQENDPIWLQGLKMTSSMALGMFIGKIIYVGAIAAINNTASECCSSLPQYTLLSNSVTDNRLDSTRTSVPSILFSNNILQVTNNPGASKQRAPNPPNYLKIRSRSL